MHFQGECTRFPTVKYPIRRDRMHKANQQNSTFVRTATHLGLLGVLAASLMTGACVSSNSNNGTGGSTGSSSITPSSGGTTGTAAGGTTAPVGGSSAGGAAACNLSSGVVLGCQLPPNPAILAVTDTCSIGLWAGDTASGGGFYAPWCTATDGTSTCTLALACSGASNSLHVTGSYSGSGNGNAGFGTISASHV